MNLTNVEMALIIMEGSILFSLLIILFYLKRILAKASDKKYPLRDSNQWRESIQESEVICQNLSKNLQEKKEIGKRLVKQLDDKIQTLSSMMKKIDQKEGPTCEDTEKKDLKGQILEDLFFLGGKEGRYVLLEAPGRGLRRFSGVHRNDNPKLTTFDNRILTTPELWISGDVGASHPTLGSSRA